MSSSQSSSLGQTIDSRENIPLPSSPPPSISANSDLGTVVLDNGNIQTAQPSWNSNSDTQRVRSPTFGVQVSDTYKLRHCVNLQCGRGFDGIPVSSNGPCPPSLSNGSFPAYMHHHQMLPLRVQHHHHPTSGPSCHPHQPQPPPLGPFPNLQTPHSLDRMMHTPSANQQIRSVVMNHYPSNSGCLHHNSTPSNGTGYYPPTTSSTSGVPVNGPSYLEYNHHNHHGPSMSPSGNSSSSYRAMAAAHHHKIINQNQAAALAAYQNVYHQYTQYIHHQGMMHALQNQQGGTSEYAWNQNMIGIPMNGGPSSIPHPHIQQTSHQPPACLFPFMNRISSSHGQSVPPFQQHHHRHHHHAFSACHPQIVPNCFLPNQHHPQPQSRAENGVFHNQAGSPRESTKTETKSSSLSESQSSKDSSVKETHNGKKNRKGTSTKTGSSKISSTSSEKSSKAKSAKSVTRLRERQPRLIVGQKKKSLMNITGTSNSRKHKSLSKTQTIFSGFLCKQISGSGTDSGPSRTVKRSKLTPKKQSDDDVSVTSASGSTSSGKSDDDDEQSKPGEEIMGDNKELEFDRYCLEDALDEEYVPTPEEMIEYLERLNACSSLNLPLHHAYSVFQENGIDKDCSDCSVECVDGVLEETECLNCLTWQQQQYDICPSRPPPGFEHLSRPAFPIELYDPSLLGNLVGSQMPRGSVTQVTSPDSGFEDVQDVLTSLTCCEKHAIDKIWNMKKSSSKLHEDPLKIDGSECDWESLDKAIRNVLDDWTEELYFRKKVQQILFGLNLHEVYGGCCKTSASEETSNNTAGKSSFGFTPLITREEQSQIRYFIEDSIL